MLSTTRNAIQHTLMDERHVVGLRYHSTRLWASCPPSFFLLKEQVQVRFQATKPSPQYSRFGNQLRQKPQDVGFHLQTDTKVHKESATLRFSDGTTHTIRDPSLHCNEKEYTFQNRAISIRPQLTGRHEVLTPPFVHLQEYISTPRPLGPHSGVLIGSSRHGELYGLPDEPLSPNPDDVEEWGCTAALAVRHTSPPETTWVYLDGSAGGLGYRSAATLFFPMGYHGSCAQHLRTSPQRDRSSERLSCCYEGPSCLTHASPL